MDQDTVPRDATSTVLRLLRRLCAAAPAPGGAWREAFIAFLWRLWSRLQACKNRNGAAPVPVADTRTLDGDDAEVTEDDDDYYLGKKEGALHIERTKNSDANLAGPSALGKDNVGNNAHLAGPGALGVDSKCKNAYLDGQAELGKDDVSKEYELGIGPVTPAAGPAAATKDDAGYFSKVTEEDGDEGYFSCKSKVTEEDDDDARSKNDRAFGIQSNDVDSKIKNAQDTDLAKDDVSKNAELGIGPVTPAAATKDDAGGENEPAPPAPRSSSSSCSSRRRHPAQAVRAVRSGSVTPVLDDLQGDEHSFDGEVDECKAMHEGYAAACSDLKKNKTLCLECFIRHEKNPATARPPVPINNDEEEVRHHMSRLHKCGSDWCKCKRRGCYAMTVTAQDMGHHQSYVHRM